MALLAVASLTCVGACGDDPAESSNERPPRGTLDIDPDGFGRDSDADAAYPADAEQPKPDVHVPSEASTPPVEAGPGDTGAPDIGGEDAEIACTGFSTPCSLLTTSQCATALGCHMDGSCSGLSASCYYQSYSYSCNALQGCYWSSYYDNCQGSSWSCSMFSNSYGCVGQDGCHWSDKCEGTAFACEDLTPSTCESQPGCTLVGGL